MDSSEVKQLRPSLTFKTCRYKRARHHGHIPYIGSIVRSYITRLPEHEYFGRRDEKIHVLFCETSTGLPLKNTSQQ